MGRLLRAIALFSGFLFLTDNIQAQRIPQGSFGCATPQLTAAQRKNLEQSVTTAKKTKTASAAAVTTIAYVPIRPHILRKSDGSGGISLASINQIIAVTNSYYLQNNAGIQFYLAGTTPDYVDDDDQYAAFTDEETVANSHDVSNALNQYYVHAFKANGVSGYAYFPANAIYSTRSFILDQSPNLTIMGNQVVPHELGHNFNLIHTFGNSNTSQGTSELVTRGNGANCTTDGDLLCDTPADPYGMSGTALVYDKNYCPSYDPNSTARDANGDAYSPSISNIMSYYSPCTHNFTAGQYDRIQGGLTLRQSHTAYTLDYPATEATAPSSISARVSSGVVIISWQDNATNDMGYFVERSTSASGGFVPIGGVGPNTTSFTDGATASQTVYYYRVKPSNTTTGAYSTTAVVRSPPCRPAYTVGCGEGDGLNSFTIANTTLSTGTGCSSTAYSQFTATSATITAGQSVNFSGTLLNNQYPEGVGIWVDLNRNGKYEATERLAGVMVDAGSTQFTGTLTLPASLSAGSLSLRLIVNFNEIPADACGSYSYGETEDYQLYVTTSADLSLSVQAGTRTSLLSKPISYSVTIRNDGPSDATGFQWQNRLPPNMTYVDSGTTIAGSATAVSATSNLSLASGQTLTMTYQLAPGKSGVYQNAVQILSSAQPDPDSQPGSGTGDGQDDTASIDLRTVDSTRSLTVYASPNPNQTPLPPVLSNQPASSTTAADLSVGLTVDKLVASVGKPVTFTISVTNAGGLTAVNTVVRDTLKNLTFVSSPSGLSVVSSGQNYMIVEGKISSLVPSNTAYMVFTATPTATGTLQNTAQVWSAGQPDPDSQPGSLTPNANNLNGEDDVSLIRLRILSP